MKKGIIAIIVIVGILVCHNNYLIKISKLEKKITNKKIEIENLKKELNKKQNEYNKISDLKNLELEMKKKKNMEISSEIIYFKIKKDSKDI